MIDQYSIYFLFMMVNEIVMPNYLEPLYTSIFLKETQMPAHHIL